MKKLLVLLLLMYPLSATAVTYQWTDEAGTVNFAEDLGKVPKKYRKKVKVLGAEENGPPQIIENGDTDKGKPKDTGGSAKTKPGSGARDEAALRREYDMAQAQLKATQQDVADLRTRLADTSKMTRGEYLSLQNSLKHEEFRLQDQLRKLDQLRQRAEKAGVNLEQK